MNVPESRSNKYVAVLKGWYRSALADKWRVFQVCAFLALAVATFYAINANQDDTRSQASETLSNQRAGCDRTNALRMSINQRTEDLYDLTAVTNRLFSEIAKSPRATPAIKAEIKATTDKYESISASYKKLPTINCAKAYPAKDAAARVDGENVEVK